MIFYLFVRKKIFKNELICMKLLNKLINGKKSSYYFIQNKSNKNIGNHEEV